MLWILLQSSLSTPGPEDGSPQALPCPHLPACHSPTGPAGPARAPASGPPHRRSAPGTLSPRNPKSSFKCQLLTRALPRTYLKWHVLFPALLSSQHQTLPRTLGFTHQLVHVPPPECKLHKDRKFVFWSLLCPQLLDSV